jgi:tryptophan 2,3-dioxygenase
LRYGRFRHAATDPPSTLSPPSVGIGGMDWRQMLLNVVLFPTVWELRADL